MNKTLTASTAQKRLVRGNFLLDFFTPRSQDANTYAVNICDGLKALCQVDVTAPLPSQQALQRRADTGRRQHRRRVERELELYKQQVWCGSFLGKSRHQPHKKQVIMVLIIFDALAVV